MYGHAAIKRKFDHVEVARWGAQRLSFVVITLGLLLTSSWAQDLNSRFSVNVGETNLVEGLRLLQRSTGAKLVFSPDQLRALTTKGVVGEFTTEEALERLLAGSGFRAQSTGKGAYVICVDGDDDARI
jgi:hypothetical protein